MDISTEKTHCLPQIQQVQNWMWHFPPWLLPALPPLSPHTHHRGWHILCLPCWHTPMQSTILFSLKKNLSLSLTIPSVTIFDVCTGHPASTPISTHQPEKNFPKIESVDGTPLSETLQPFTPNLRAWHPRTPNIWPLVTLRRISHYSLFLEHHWHTCIYLKRTYFCACLCMNPFLFCIRNALPLPSYLSLIHIFHLANSCSSLKTLLT